MILSRPLTAVAILLTVVAVVLPMRSQAFTFVNVDGRAVRMLVQGSGPATVVFENAMGPPLEMWGKVQPAVSAFAKTVSYDRAGKGHHVASELRRALRLANLPPPYVLVGASLGGQFVRIYAGLYPEDVVGMVLVDPTPDSQRTDAKGSRIPPGVPVFLIRAEGPLEVPFATGTIRAARRDRRPAIAAESREHTAWIDAIPGGRLIVTRDSSHNVPMEQPDLVVDTIRRALEDTR